MNETDAEKSKLKRMNSNFGIALGIDKKCSGQSPSKENLVLF